MSKCRAGDHRTGDALDELPTRGWASGLDTLGRLGEVSERSKERDWKSRGC